MKAKSTKNWASGKRTSQTDEWLVFVSHATADKWIAKVICEKIESTGASSFRDDRDVDGGDEIPDKIRREIIRAKEVVVLLTPVSVNRPWVQFEVGAAWGRNLKKRITTVLLHVKEDRIPGMIKSKKAIPLNDFDTYIGELKRRVNRQIS